MNKTKRVELTKTELEKVRVRERSMTADSYTKTMLTIIAVC